jgi:hypothetical protein
MRSTKNRPAIDALEMPAINHHWSGGVVPVRMAFGALGNKLNSLICMPICWHEYVDVSQYNSECIKYVKKKAAQRELFLHLFIIFIWPCCFYVHMVLPFRTTYTETVWKQSEEENIYT